MAAVGDKIPTGSFVDIISSDGNELTVQENIDAATSLNEHKLAVLFAVPGAFTPTCSAKHLPGFIEKAHELKAKGVEAVYCMSVNDRFVMKAWGKATEGFMTSGIRLIGDGNASLSAALKLTKDASTSRMGTRSLRFAMILEYGVIKALFIDEKGLEKSSAESVLASLLTI